MFDFKTYNKAVKQGYYPKHKRSGRGYSKFYYTFKDMANITGLKVETVREYGQKGKFNPRDLLSVSKFLIGRVR